MNKKIERNDKRMKRKNGFTLIELLAVIVILAIIALIAVPVVMNIIGKANKSAFKDSAYGLLKAGESYYMSELLEDAQEITEDKVFTFPNNIEGLEFKGSKPSKGSMTVRKDGKVSMAIANGKYCVTKGFDDEDVIIKEDDGTCVLESYNLGDIVYYNPNEAKVCTEAEWNNNADKNGKSGCMRWYVYALNGSTPKLILDHNTTNKVAWISEDDYVDNANCVPVPCSDQGAKTLEKQLKKDIENWHESVKMVADIITAEEMLNLLPYYKNLSSNEKELFLTKTIEMIDKYGSYVDMVINDVCTKSETNTSICESGNVDDIVELLGAQPNSPFLPSYMFKDIFYACTSEDECTTFGYWSKTAVGSHGAWNVDNSGTVGMNGAGHIAMDDNGLRPVITLSK